jgi:hypothetical protein
MRAWQIQEHGEPRRVLRRADAEAVEDPVAVRVGTRVMGVTTFFVAVGVRRGGDPDAEHGDTR